MNENRPLAMVNGEDDPRLETASHENIEEAFIRLELLVMLLAVHGWFTVKRLIPRNSSPGSYQRLDLFIKVLRVLCPNVTAASR